MEKVKVGEEAEMRVALWDRVSKNGNEYKYARLDIPQQQRKAEPTPPVVEEVTPDLSDDDLPF